MKEWSLACLSLTKMWCFFIAIYPPKAPFCYRNNRTSIFVIKPHLIIHWVYSFPNFQWKEWVSHKQVRFMKNLLLWDFMCGQYRDLFQHPFPPVCSRGSQRLKLPTLALRTLGTCTWQRKWICQKLLDLSAKVPPFSGSACYSCWLSSL